ncbi:MAG: phosphate ABC transporter permease subunit PstC [Bacteroidales bacterium]|nr:phosphate ABC transporter permease subunit PstC [Bacteroidales bacterium]
MGLFREKPLEADFIIAVNKSNTVKKLDNQQIGAVFNQDITNWKELGGDSLPIEILSLYTIENYYSEEDLGEDFSLLPQKINEFLEQTPGAIVCFTKAFMPEKIHGDEIHIDNIELLQFLKGKSWLPTSQPVAQLGILPLILGTLWVSLGAILIALPLGVASAIYMAEVAKPKLRNLLKPVIELLSGIPSVVYGFFGLIIIVPFIQQLFNVPVGETALAGSIVLAIMALPTIITISEDAIRTTPLALREASLALGATRWQTVLRVVIPYSKSGISAGIILGIGRAIGETMAVLMVTGNAGTMPTSFLQPVRTIPATIAAELGEVPMGGVHYKALFMLGIILFLINMIINISVEYIKKGRVGR